MRQSVQDLQVERRQVGNAKEGNPLRQNKSAGDSLPDPFQEDLAEGSPVLLLQPSGKISPEYRLPVIFRSKLPAADQIGTIEHVLVKGFRNAPGELQLLETPGRTVEIVLQTFESRFVQMVREQFHDAPSSELRIKKGDIGKAGDYALKGLVDKCIGKGKPDVGAHSKVPGKLQRKPPLHSLTLDDNDFLVQG